MSKKEQITVGISIGDLNGIGGEIILKTFLDSRMLEFCTPVIFASVKLMSFYKKHFGLQMNLHGIHKLDQIAHKKINVFNVWKEGVNVQFGEEHPEAGAYAIKSFKSAVRALKEDNIDVLVTAPIHKHNIQAEDFKFPGHTDYLNQELEGNSMMFMINESLRVGLLTDHLPVKDVSAAITPELIETKIKTVTQTLKQDFGIITPKVAVLGINPHTGDNGVIGKEDDEVVRPTLAKLNEEGTLVYGPYAADSFFGTKNHLNFDAIIAAYHDQGLVPFKTLSFGQGVNYTAGLHKIRTSPDHGTAYDKAGKGEADHTSFKEAVFSAIQIYKTRQEYLELSANPLQKRARKVLAKKR
ncbi:4-hydroxythreonine-4-phosphate dehydrogenase PdxA [Gilvibacter sediminis]|uniref:4-hydroxythreonine-4-phosphate dehydrogenase PdxA n=1 Tax=Gilvibacter sediminis TaxID=379071 RepID=UPI0023502D09|nr:4-hydroxythreonine-4-phosphate dehydrogenase PdxA [Gilvibacter sediminis]MDC7996845.1 4-hydroxythreonine-4-phosphate dehydrogenase PdxA [Gilvibacter sediminis]